MKNHSLLLERENGRETEEKELFISTNDFAILYLLGSYFRAFFSSAFPPHSFITSDLVLCDKTAKTNKKSGRIVFSNRSLEIISKR
jgi:hypothetical protein